MRRQQPTRSRRSFRRGRSRIGLWFLLGSLVLLALFFAALDYSRPHVSGDDLRLDQFFDYVERGRVEKATLLDYDAFVVGEYVRDDGSTAAYNAPYLKDALRDVVELLVMNRVPTTVDQQNGKRVAEAALVAVPALLFVALFVYLILAYRSGRGLFGIRSGARRIQAEDANVTFADVAGQSAAVTELREIVQFLKEPERFSELGARIPKGILLFGPPGCGKTLLAKALAGEGGANFYSISGSDFVEMFVGVGASRVRDLFREARENAPALIFIDELDAIGRARGVVGTVAAHGEQEQALNQILAEMDGFSPTEGIIVIGATNRPDILDQALLRPGRFDRPIGLERPDEKARLEILSLHAKGKPLGPDADLEATARRAVGLSGADLASVVNEAALLAGRNRKKAIGQEDLDQALQRILEAPERQRRLSMRERTVAKRFVGEERVTFADVAGVDDAVQELLEVREYLTEPGRFAALGARVPRGILLIGPPGCGKTLLGRAVAGEANAAFFSVAASEFVEVFVGEGASRVRELFAEARSVAPAIVFIDEIDSIGGRRSGVSWDGSREREQTLNQILVELDGFEAQSGVIVMAATNRPDMLDPALVRPGRFDRQVAIDPPDREGRKAILKIHAQGKPLAKVVDLDRVAALTRGFSGADLANVMNEASLLAARKRREEITMDLIEEGIERTMTGVASRGKIMSDEERRMVAYHEAGHGLVAFALPGADPPHKLTIVPRAHSLGQAWFFEESERYLHTRSGLLDRMAVGLGGRTAEQLVFNDISDGAGSDLARVTEVARRMVCELGMSEKVGPIAYPDYSEGMRLDGRPPRTFSEDAARTIDSEVGRVVGEAEARARSVLVSLRRALDEVAKALIEQETLSSDQLEKIARAAGVSTAAKRGGTQRSGTVDVRA